MNEQKNTTNAQKNSLVNRLYKSHNKKISSSLKPINLPHLQPIGSLTDSKRQSQPKYLVPKIMKDKLKPLDNESRMKSKLFSNLDQSFDMQTDREHSTFMQQSRIILKSPLPSLAHNRSKLYSMATHENLLQSMELREMRYDTKQLEYERIKSKVFQTDRMREDYDSSPNQKKKSYLTPNDFMQILKIDREMSEQFCYMNKTSPFNPYDWKIVQFENRNPHEYMVISKRGLTKYYFKEVQFIPFEQFLQQQKIYNRLSKIAYFKYYYHQKYFQIWKKFSSVSVFKLRFKMFEEVTLLADQYLNEMRHDIKKLCQNLQSIQTFYTQTLSNMEIEDFKLYATNEKNKTVGKLKDIETLILDILKEKTSRSMEIFMKKMRISKESQKNSIQEKKVPLLIGDETGKQMPYTESATLRTHQRKIRNFIKLVDYLILTSKVELIISMIKKLTENICEINSFFNNGKQAFSNYAWINVKIYEQDDEIRFQPSEETFIQELEEVVYGTIASICNSHRQYLHEESFSQYWQCNIQAEKADEYIDIKGVININNNFNENINEFRYQVKTSFFNLKQYSALYKRSLSFIQYIKEISEMDLVKENAEFFKNTLGKIREELKALSQIDNMKDVGIILLNSTVYKQKIEKQAEQLVHKINALIPDILLNRSQHLLDDIRRNYDLIGMNPLTIKEYIEFLRNTIQVNKFTESTSPMIADNSYLLTLSEAYGIKIGESVRQVLGDANGQMIGLSRRMYQIEKGANQMAEKFKKEIDKLVPTFQERLKVQKEKLVQAQLLKNNQKLQKKLSLISDLSRSLQLLIKDKNELRKYQQELSLTITEFQQIDSYEHYFKLLQSLWNEKKIWLEFYEKNWIRVMNVLKFQEIKKYLDTLTKKLATFQRELQLNEVVVSFKTEVEKLKPLFFSVEALTNQALKEKHFQKIRQLIRDNFINREFPSQSILIEDLFVELERSIYTFQFFDMIELQKFKDEIIEIAVQAEKEAELLDMITQVETIWKTTQMVVIPYKEGKDTILGNNDQLITKVDDNLLIVNNILASKYVAPLKQRVEVQAKMLRYMQDLIDEWYLHQRNWIYLQPILRSPFALKNLPKESSMFNQIDNKWKIMMKQAKDSMNIKKYADQVSSTYTLKTLRANNQLFDIVQKALENFLQKKRDLFQRFYFLSNDELLQILSTVKSFEQIEPHLKKVFENFVSIKLDEKGIPLAMVSGQGEVVPLRNCIFRGQVEEWFKSAEESMKLTLRSVIRQAQLKFTEEGMRRSNWMKMYPSQVVLVVDCLMWTRITQGYLEDPQENDITEWYNTSVQQLDQLVEMIRGDLTKLQRKLLVALITQDVHFRDIIEGLNGCESVSDFKWIQQLRFYNLNQNVVARQVQAELTYGYEYLGATSRLVITPLTDRCWITITGALHIKLGANPAGPAGTGKTESCKDLAKSLGRYCIVFNCSDQITALMMQKLFTGLSFTGSWTCLDEFNRIDIEVLSVIAQQVLTIRQALLIGKHVKEFEFGGKKIYLNHDLGIFITMNPGYAGRTQLPDNLKTLFRPVAMMVPDYTLIAEIMLFSEGFSSAKELSKKMTKLYKLSSEQLSQQDHYDFGMRAVKSVLVMAGGLKRQQPDLPEEVVLIRAMQDSNIPKFLSYDIPLFNSIIEDLFPSVLIPKRNQQELINKLKTKCSDQNIISTPKFIQKCLQFNQTLKVRFGVMLVGPPMGSKTKIVGTLLDTFPTIINPKAVSLAELYGNFDILTQTWSDGLAAKILRETVTSHEYIMFDGPVDAIWVENLNTVLDDSQMLCLSNGQRIKLSPKSRILFEVLDLNQASPATVSRCGMVWVSEDVVSWQEYVEGFFKRNILLQKEEHQNFLEYLVKNSFRKGYQYVKKFCKEVIKINANSLVSSYCKFLKNTIHLIPQKSLETQSWKKPIEKICIFAYTWSIGAILTEEGRSKLDKSVSDSFSPDSLKSPINNFVVHYNDRPQGQWVSWNSILPTFEFPEETFTFSELFIPTKENYCYSYILNFFVAANDPVFLYGPTGTGKTSILQQITKAQNVASLHFTFTAQTSPNIAQIQLESKLASQRKAGNIMLIPPPGKKFIYAIDDISMPKIEQYGAQPPIEMLRLILSGGGVWDRKNHAFKQVQNVEMIISGTQGRNELPPRFLRFFNTLYITELQQESITLIFSQITKGTFRRQKLKPEVMDLIDNKSIVNATLSLYEMAKVQFLPTPAKSHYLFNIRDVSKVIQGISMIKPSSISNPDNLVKLWVHEFQRVFEDRLVNQEDKKFIKEEIAKKVSVSMKSSLTQENLFKSSIVFGNFLKKGADKKQRIYEESKDFAKLTKTIMDYMQDQSNMNLILFSDAVLHICRVSRCLIMERGHILLVGLTGSGKQSSIMLGAILSQCGLMTINIRKNYGKNQFRQDLFKIMKKAAIQNSEVCFMFPETHILQESFLEDINNLLSSGQVPAMFTKDQLDQIAQSTGYEVFIKRVVANLHVALTLSPIGDAFRSRIRNFPSLVNCCAIDWVSKWPQQALINVASSKLQEQRVIENCVKAQKQIQTLAQNFYLNTKRKIYITSKNYIELIEMFNELLIQQRNKIETQIHKLSNGVYKLQESNSLIEDLKIKLTDLRPILQKKTVEQVQLLKRLEIDRLEAGEAKGVVQEEEKQISQKTQKALEEKKQADKILNDALPTLHAANEALNTLNRNDISQIKMNQNPHAQVKFTLQCVSVLLQQKQDWETIRKTISDINFISRLKNLDVYNIPQKVQNILKNKLKTNPNFKPSEIKQINFAAKSFCEWVLAVVNFAEINKEIVKKKTIVKKLNDELDISNKQLAKKREQLQQIINKLKVLQNQYISSKDEKEKLDNEIIVTKKRLINAEQLTVGLASEKIRWAEKLVEFEEQKKQIVGNIFLATCFTALLGPYSSRFRQEYIETIKKSLDHSGIIYSKDFTLQYTLGDPLQIGDWINYGLPKDSFSIDNAILLKKTNKNPLMVDPQLQASKWLKSYKKGDDLVSIKMNNENTLKIVENAIRMKYPLLLELVQPSFDPSLNSLLSKEFEIVNNRYFVKLGQSRLEIDPKTKIFLYTKLSNPAFSPEIFIKLTVINFMVTPQGLDDQLLAMVVQNELPEIQLKKRELISTISKGKTTLQKNEDKILQLLNNSKGNILDDEELIMNLKVSKKVSTEVKISLQQNVIKSKQIEKARAVYRPIAQRGTKLYLVIDDISSLDQMYQFSLEYFAQIFIKVLKNSPFTEDSQLRVRNVVDELTLIVYSNVSRSLFNQHKRIFAFVIAVRIQQVDKKLYNYFVKGNYSLEKKLQKPNKPIQNLSQEVCLSLFNLKQIMGQQIYEIFLKQKQKTLAIKDNPINSFKNQPLNHFGPFQKLILTKIIRPQITVEAMTQYVHDTIGQPFLNTDAVPMNIVYDDTTNKIPLIFVLSVGADPLQSILRLAKEKGKKTEEVLTISLGQGQGPAAQKAIQSATKQGGWVVLQNCHLGKSFLPVLQKRIQQLSYQQDLHQNFRLYLTSMPCDYFPVTILQNSLKLTSEPPRGIKSNMKKIMQVVNWGESDEQKTFTFNLCLFHAIILQRRKFGPLGWNILYDFNESDLTTSLTVVNNLITSFDDIPFEAIQYFVGEIIYGGRVTDQYDRRLLKTMLNDFISPEVIDKPRVSPDSINNYLQYVENLPEYDLPSVFGLNQNGQKTYLFKLAKQAFDSIVLLEPQEISQNKLDKTISMVEGFLHHIPAIIKKNQDKKHQDALEITLMQEAARFNKLITFIETNCKQIISALKGEIIMNEELEKSLFSISNNQVPKSWAKRAYPSLKPLASWFEDFIERVKFFKNALNEKPKMYWISAFFFPQGFLTSILQIQARKLKVPIDSLSFQYIFKQNLFKESTDGAPAQGCLIYGLHSEACCIDLKSSIVKQSMPDVIDTEVPAIHFKPIQSKGDQVGQYCEIPLYKTKLRAGTLSTTGHSTNFIISISCKTDQQDSYWIKRGAAFFCSLEK